MHCMRAAYNSQTCSPTRNHNGLSTIPLKCESVRNGPVTNVSINTSIRALIAGVNWARQRRPDVVVTQAT